MEIVWSLRNAVHQKVIVRIKLWRFNWKRSVIFEYQAIVRPKWQIICNKKNWQGEPMGLKTDVTGHTALEKHDSNGTYYAPIIMYKKVKTSCLSEFQLRRTTLGCRRKILLLGFGWKLVSCLTCSFLERTLQN